MENKLQTDNYSLVVMNIADGIKKAIQMLIRIGCSKEEVIDITSGAVDQLIEYIELAPEEYRDNMRKHMLFLESNTDIASYYKASKFRLEAFFSSDYCRKCNGCRKGGTER